MRHRDICPHPTMPNANNNHTTSIHCTHPSYFCIVARWHCPDHTGRAHNSILQEEHPSLHSWWLVRVIFSRYIVCPSWKYENIFATAVVGHLDAGRIRQRLFVVVSICRYDWCWMRVSVTEIRGRRSLLYSRPVILYFHHLHCHCHRSGGSRTFRKIAAFSDWLDRCHFFSIHLGTMYGLFH